VDANKKKAIEARPDRAEESAMRSRGSSSEPNLFKRKLETLSPSARRELDTVERRLARFYAAEDIPVWLVSRHPLLKGKRAIDLIGEGRTDRVLAVIDSLADGSYS